MSEKIFKGTPFDRPIVWREFSRGEREGDFKILPVLQGRNKVIRRFPLYRFKENPQQEVLTAWAVFNEFGSYPNLNVPKFSIVQGLFGEDDIHQPYLFIVDLIKGKNLVAKNFSTRERGEATEVLSGFLGSFINYAEDKYKNGGLYPSDQLYLQYVYGKAPREDQNRVYFVDLDFYFDMFNTAQPDAIANEVFFNHIVGFIAELIELSEVKLQNGSLTSVREQYVDFLNSILGDNHPFAHKALLFKDVLEGKRTWR